MKASANRTQDNESRAVANNVSCKREERQSVQFVDNSPHTKRIAQLQAMMDRSVNPHDVQMRKLLAIINNSPQRKKIVLPGVTQKKGPLDEDELQFKSKEAVQKKGPLDEDELQFKKDETVQCKGPLDEEELQFKAEEPVQKQENKTGLPDELKAGVENLSGMAMDDVRVQYNSSKPAQLNAYAYTQGTEIHVAPGQEKHLPHEAWHVVQQKQGRVQPTMQMKSSVLVNDDRSLEREADVMGDRAEAGGVGHGHTPALKKQAPVEWERKTSPSLSGQSAVQLTAWMKSDGSWKRKEQTKKDGRINWELDTLGEKAPPDPAIGEEGWVFSSNRMKYFKKYSDYRNEVLLGMPSKENGEIETTDVKNEETFLKGEAINLSFIKDITHNYLLWSVPKYTGRQMQKGEGKRMPLTDLSGEARAEEKSRRKKGYMMKQTLEHFEALTVLKAKLANESDLGSRVVAQYGKSTSPNSYDPTKVDALHYPRDPQYQLDLIDVLKKIESFWDVAKDERNAKIQEIKQAITTVASTKLAKQIVILMQKHQADQKRNVGKVNESSRERAFNRVFYKNEFPHRLMQSIKAKKKTKDDPYGAIGSRDDKEEVTRAPLKEKSVELVGGRNAVFETIWGPKSSEVVDKAARRKDAVVSHGLKYHFSPASTVQAKYEFPPYKALVEKTLGPICMMGRKKKYYNKAIKALEEILSEINKLKAMVSNLSWKTQGNNRDNNINNIQRHNNDLVIAMANLRKELMQEVK